jgi:hypothetical protein
MVPVIQRAKDSADKAGRHLVVVGFVCGTLSDPQNLSKQEAALREVGVILAESNAQAVRIATTIALGAGTVEGMS